MTGPLRRSLPLALALAAGCDGCGTTGDSAVWVEEREPCDDYVAERQVLWGDLHAHTALSFDAWVYDVRLLPEDAYAFARGEQIWLPPLGADGQGTTPVQLERPLDFAAVTDHAEFLGEISGCTTPGSAIYDAELCAEYRVADASSVQMFGTRLAALEPTRQDEICGGDFDCLARADTIWARIQEANEAAYDRSAACTFTSFVGYEWSGSTSATNFHRNVIFRSERVPDRPTSYFEAPTAQELWDALDEGCLEGLDGCDVLAIPHNSNLSNGAMFHVEDGTDAGDAGFRIEMEPLLEIYQHKGDSECRVTDLLGATDEACGFEKFRLEEASDCGDEPGAGGISALGCESRLDFLRGILLEGLTAEQALGVNPYALGVIASSDTHSATPGLVAEDAYIGHLGIDEMEPEGRLEEPGLNPGGVVNSGGGLAGVWAEENSRSSIFEALRRKEVFGTSGPRIPVRVFAGWGFDDDICGDPELVGRGYAGGTPMGGRLGGAPAAGGAPTIVVSALADPEGEAPLERIQIVKGWLEPDGGQRIEVFDVAGEIDAEGVDLETCEPSGAGAASLCAAWTDPDFDPDQPAFYYARVLQAPTCRWSWRDCLTFDEAERPSICDDDRVERAIQERAWSSPIWY